MQPFLYRYEIFEPVFPNNGFSATIPALFLKDRDKISPHFKIRRSAAIPFPNDSTGGRVETGDPVEPADTGVQRQMSGARMIPGDLGGQTAHGNCAGETSVNQQRTPFFKQVDKSIQALFGHIGQPRLLQFMKALLRKHGKTPFYSRNAKGQSKRKPESQHGSSKTV
jgi:hypothetical protein